MRQAGTTPAVGIEPSGRLDPDDALERGRHPARAGRVGAEREVDHARAPPPPPTPSSTRRRCARARRGRARADTGERVPTSPVANWSRLVLPTTTRPGRHAAAPPPAPTVGRGGERRAARGRRHPGDVDVVLDREGQPGQRQARRGRGSHAGVGERSAAAQVDQTSASARSIQAIARAARPCSIRRRRARPAPSLLTTAPSPSTTSGVPGHRPGPAAHEHLDHLAVDRASTRGLHLHRLEATQRLRRR